MSSSSSSTSSPVFPRLEGYLKKLKSKSFLSVSSWNKRWFSVDPISGTNNKQFQLRYFNDQPTNKTIYDKASGAINLVSVNSIQEYNSTMNAVTKINDPFVFVIESDERKYILRANSQMEMNSWIDGLNLFREHEKSTIKGVQSVQIASITSGVIPTATPVVTSNTTNNKSTTNTSNTTHSNVNNSNINNNNNNRSSATSNSGPHTPPKRNSFLVNSIPQIDTGKKDTGLTNAPAPVFVQARINTNSVQSPTRPDRFDSSDDEGDVRNKTNKTENNPVAVKKSFKQLFSTAQINVSNTTITQNHNEVQLDTGDDDFSLGNSVEDLNLNSTESLDLNFSDEEANEKNKNKIKQPQQQTNINNNNNNNNNTKASNSKSKAKFQSAAEEQNLIGQHATIKPKSEYEEKVSNHTNNEIDLNDDWDTPSDQSNNENTNTNNNNNNNNSIIPSAQTPVLKVNRPLKMPNKSNKKLENIGIRQEKPDHVDQDDEFGQNQSHKDNQKGTQKRSNFFDSAPPEVPLAKGSSTNNSHNDSRTNPTISTKTNKTNNTTIATINKPKSAVVAASSSDTFAEHVLKADENFVEEDWD